MHEFWDRIGISTSILCVLHCLLTPVLLVVAPLVGARLHADWIHPAIITIAVPVAVWALWAGYRHHKRTSTLILGAIGLGFIAAAAFSSGDHHGRWEVIFMVAAGVFLATAHYRNLTACRHKH